MINISNNIAKEDEIDLVALVKMFWSYRKWIIIGTVLITLIGLFKILTATPIYYSYAIIAPKDSDNPASSSMLSGFGGIVASQLGIGQNSLDRLEILLKTNELNNLMIRKYNLMPILFPYTFKEKDSTVFNDLPRIHNGINLLKNNHLYIKTNQKKNIMTVGVYFRSPEMAKQLVDYYLIVLDEQIKRNVVRNASNNRKYLKEQIALTSDPLLREKLQNLISVEIEKTMLVSHSSFDILDKSIIQNTMVKPKRKINLIISFIVGLLISILCITVFDWYKKIATQKMPSG